MFLEHAAAVIYAGTYHYRTSQNFAMLQPSDDLGWSGGDKGKMLRRPLHAYMQFHLCP
jgi:hypothetical protein